MMRRWLTLAAPLTVLRSAAQGLELIAWALFARRLGPAAFGVLAIGFLSARWGALVADWGAAQHGPRNVAAMAADDTQHLLRTRVTATAVLVPLFAAATVVVNHPHLAVLAAVIANGGVSRDWVALGRGRSTRSSVPSIVRGAALLAGSMAVTTLDATALVVAVAYLAATIASLAMNPVEAAATRRSATRPAAVWALIMVLGAQVYTTLDTLLLGLLRSSREAGIYNALYRIPLGVSTIVGLAVAALVPPLTDELRSGRLSVTTARRHLTRVAMVGGGLVLGATPLLVAFGPELFGAAYSSGRVALALVLVATALATTASPMCSLWLACGEERRLAGVVALGALVNLAGNLVLIPWLGMAGAGTTTVLSEALVLGYVWSFSAHRTAPVPAQAIA